MSARENIAAWRKTASADDISAGRDWYPFARRVARDLARAHGVSGDVAAGVIAALSPRCSWPENLAAADTVLRAYAAGEPMPTGVPGVYPANLRKAWNIVGHGDGFPRCNGTRIGARGTLVACVAGRDGCAAAQYLHGPKVCEFHETINGRRDGRVLDVWATRAADVSPYEVGTLAADDPRRAGIPGSRLAALQDAYVDVAVEYGEDPRATQAIVWTRIRRVWLRTDGKRNRVRDDIPF